MPDPKKTQLLLQFIVNLAVDKTSQVLSKMLRAGSRVALNSFDVTDISKATEAVMASDAGDVFGAYIDLVGEMPFKFLFYVAAEDALVLTDLMLRREIGTAKEYDIYVESCVQELGNILASAVTNVLASDFQVKMRPTPPKVVHDFASTVFTEFIMDVAAEQKDILMIETQFFVVRTNVRCRMFLLPVGDVQKELDSIMAKG